MKKLIWWFLALPLLPLALVYCMLRGLYILGELADKGADKMYDSKWRLKYIDWRNKKFG
ncbi:hypothetical protein M5494_004393 [Salmonella enterica]|nr:hypothetical protein [Salmonella enterica]